MSDRELVAVLNAFLAVGLACVAIIGIGATVLAVVKIVEAIV